MRCGGCGNVTKPHREIRTDPEMGIFDLFRTTEPSGARKGRKDTSAEDATRLIDEGHALEAESKLAEAMQCYLEAIRRAPNPARGHLNRGNVLLLQGDLQGALDAFRTALEHQPDYAGAYYNIGNALLGNQQLDEAVANYRRALEMQPDYAEAHCSLGVALKELGQNVNAAESYREALKIDQNMVEAHINLGNILHTLGQFDGAVACYQQALEIKPDYAEAHNSLGLALQAEGQLEGAMNSFRRALKIKPDFAEAHNNLGLALQAAGQLEGAMKSCRKALEIKPDFAEALNNLGLALQAAGQLEGAMKSCRKALAIKPDFAEAHNNLGLALQAAGQLEGAKMSYSRALEIKPELIEALCNMGNILKDIGQFEGASESYCRALEIKPDFLEVHSNLMFILNYTASQLPAAYLEQASKYGRVVAGKAARFASWKCAAYLPERLRVGLVSGDFQNHPVGFFLEGLLAHIDPSCIELIAYPTHHQEDELTARIRPYFSNWHSLVGKNNEAAARLIHADGVHILVDVSGHTAHNRLPVFAWKPAPVQVTWLGLPATTGVAEIDYVLGDPHATPPEFDHHFSETVWRMPDVYMCLAVPDSPVLVAPLPALSADHVTFGSFNNLTKMGDGVVAVWARILQSVPDSRLLLKTSQLNDPSTCKQTRQRFAACGISPDRLILGGTLATRDDHLATYSKVDIALDTFPYPGVTTSAEALWMGVPVLSLRGDRFISRTAESIARNAGLPDWIAADQDDYVAKAVTFASDLKHLAALRAILRQQVLASPLFDAPRFARNFEDALWGMWQHYQTQQGSLE